MNALGKRHEDNNRQARILLCRVKAIRERLLGTEPEQPTGAAQGASDGLCYALWEDAETAGFLTAAAMNEVERIEKALAMSKADEAPKADLNRLGVTTANSAYGVARA